MIDTITLNGNTYTVRTEPDFDAGYPWENSCGHGPVRESPYPHSAYGNTKRPGERPLNSPGSRETQYYYDWQAACKLARLDGWNVAPYDAPNRIQRAVQDDFDYLRGYLAGNWEYIGVIVESEDGDTESCWGVESDGDYAESIARDLAEELDARLQREAEESAFPVSCMGV